MKWRLINSDTLQVTLKSRLSIIDLFSGVVEKHKILTYNKDGKIIGKQYSVTRKMKPNERLIQI